MPNQNTILALGKVADALTQIIKKRSYSFNKEQKDKLVILRDELNLFISDYAFDDNNTTVKGKLFKKKNGDFYAKL